MMDKTALPDSRRSSQWRVAPRLVVLCFVAMACACGGKTPFEKAKVRPRSLHDVPVQRLSYRFEPDIVAPPAAAQADDSSPPLALILSEFETNRPDDEVMRTIVSPDKQRVLVLFSPTGTPTGEFQLDLYGSGGNLIRKLMPVGASGTFANAVSWSPDNNHIIFIARKAPATVPGAGSDVAPDAAGTANPLDQSGSQLPSATPAPALTESGPLVPVFDTDQIYICGRDGFDLRALTLRPGLIYFYTAWSPDSHMLVALACRDDEWTSRENLQQGLLPAGRPRLISIDSKERLLDDRLTDVLPIWSPDASKVATAFEYDVKLYDVAGAELGQAAISLHDLMLVASRALAAKEKPAASPAPTAARQATPAGTPDQPEAPIEFNPVFRLHWATPEVLFIQTGYVRSFSNGQINNYLRWHRLTLSPQAAVLN